MKPSTTRPSAPHSVPHPEKLHSAPHAGVPDVLSTPDYDTSELSHTLNTNQAKAQLKTFLKPDEFKMLMADENGSHMIDQFMEHSSRVYSRNNTPEERASVETLKDEMVSYLGELKNGDAPQDRKYTLYADSPDTPSLPEPTDHKPGETPTEDYTPSKQVKNQLDSLFHPNEIITLLHSEHGSQLIQNLDLDPRSNQAIKDIRDYLDSIQGKNTAEPRKALPYETLEDAPDATANAAADRQDPMMIPGFENGFEGDKTTSKHTPLDNAAVLAEIKRIKAEKGEVTGVTSKDPLEGMVDVEKAKNIDSLDAVGTSEYGAALTAYKNQLLKLEKDYPNPDWKLVHEDFDKITDEASLKAHAAKVKAWLKDPKFAPTPKGTSKGTSKKTTKTTPPTETPPTETPPTETAAAKAKAEAEAKAKAEAAAAEAKRIAEAAKGKGFGMKGMAIGAGLAGVAGYMARGNSDGNSDNDKQLLNMVRGMNPQQLRQILQQLNNR